MYKELTMLSLYSLIFYGGKGKKIKLIKNLDMYNETKLKVVDGVILTFVSCVKIRIDRVRLSRFKSQTETVEACVNVW